MSRDQLFWKMVVQKKLLPEAQLEEARKMAQARSCSPWEIISEKGWLPPETLQKLQQEVEQLSQQNTQNSKSSSSPHKNTSSATVVSCPHCKQGFPLPSFAKDAGKPVLCPHCRQKIDPKVLTQASRAQLTLPTLFLNKYRILPQKKDPFYGTAIQALQLATGRSVEIVFPPTPFLSTDEHKKEFLKHLRQWGNLTSPYLQPLLDGGEWQGRVFFVLPKVPFPTLHEFLQSKRLFLKDLQKILQNLAQALEHLHSRSLAHFALAPENCYITPHFEIILGPPLPLFVACQCFLSFSPPEFAEKRGTIRSDIYSFGKIATYLFKNVHSYEEIPARWRRWTEDMGELNPQKRPFTASELKKLFAQPVKKTEPFSKSRQPKVVREKHSGSQYFQRFFFFLGVYLVLAILWVILL